MQITEGAMNNQELCILLDSILALLETDGSLTVEY